MLPSLRYTLITFLSPLRSPFQAVSILLSWCGFGRDSCSRNSVSLVPVSSRPTSSSAILKCSAVFSKDLKPSARSCPGAFCGGPGGHGNVRKGKEEVHNTSIHTYVHTHTHVFMHAHAQYIRRHARMHTCTYACTYACTHARIHAQVPHTRAHAYCRSRRDWRVSAQTGGTVALWWRYMQVIPRRGELPGPAGPCAVGGFETVVNRSSPPPEKSSPARRRQIESPAIS